MTTLTLDRGTKREIHIQSSETTPGNVEVAIDHTNPIDRELARIVMGDDAAAVVDLTADEAVALAFDLLRASGRDVLDVAHSLLNAYDRRPRA